VKIGINALFNASGGSWTNLQQLLLDWESSNACDKHHIVIFASMSTFDKIYKLGVKKYTVVLIKHCNNIVSRILIEQLLLPLLMYKHKINVLFCPANTMPLLSHIPCVVTFQNAAPFCDNINSSTIGTMKYMRLYLLGKFIKLSANRARHVIFISNYFQNLLIEKCGFDAKRGSVIYRAKTVDPSPQHDSGVTNTYGIVDDYIFTTSHLISYRNIKELILGYSLAYKSCKGILPKLFIAGGEEFVSGYKNEMQYLINNLSLQDNIYLLGSIPHNDVINLLQNCLFFIYPSTCENCPTSLIEAMSAGRPIACSNVGVMPEIAGRAAYYFDPFVPASISKAIISMSTSEEIKYNLQSNLEDELAKFPTRQDNSAQTMNIIESVASK
jgi:glycosyltransferase involved in cell wall biosynthesis